MCSKKRDLEIIFNLQWKYGPKVAERSNIVGVYDVPSITLSWEPFKSYILKNSGTPGGDVRVSYLEDGREIAINTTLDFQTALYTFRKKAMRGEIINLMLERLSIGFKPRISPTCDAQTECTEDYKMEKAPEWFSKYMTDFKKEIFREMSTIVTSHVAAVKPVPSYSHYPRKSKTECSKRCRKAHHHHHDVNEKEVLKTMKMEKKLETKMEKLVNKSKKLKDKKMSLITKSSDSDAGHSSSKSNSEIVSNVESNVMNAAPVRTDSIKSPHFMGGEVYHHSWEVINNGSAPWTKDTELHFSWGSSLLQPIQRVIPCPHLKPMETGQIEAMIHVPKICGKYQMYWHFYHRGRKFGHWLGCEIIVDKVNSAEQLSTTFLKSIAARYNGYYGLSEEPGEHRSIYGAMLKNPTVDLASSETTNDEVPAGPFQIGNMMKDLKINEKEIPQKTWTPDFVPTVPLALNMSPSKIQIIENYMDPISKRNQNDRMIDNLKDSMDANHNVDEESDGDSHSESISKIDEDTSSNSTLNDMVILDIPDEEEEQENAGYAYVTIDGIKTPVPKKYLRTDFLESAEDAPEPKNDDDQACTEKKPPTEVDEKESNRYQEISKEFYVVNKDFDDILESTNPIPPNQHGSNLSDYGFPNLSPLLSPTPGNYIVGGPNISPWPSDYLDLLSAPNVLPGNNVQCTFELAPHMKYFSRTPIPPSGPEHLLDCTPEQSLKSENRNDCTPQKSPQQENDRDDTPEQSPQSENNLDSTPERAPRSRTHLECESETSPRSEDCSPEKAYRPESFLNRPFRPERITEPLPRMTHPDLDYTGLRYRRAYENYGPYFTMPSKDDFTKMNKDDSSSDSDLLNHKPPLLTLLGNYKHYPTLPSTVDKCISKTQPAAGRPQVTEEELNSAAYRFKIFRGSKPVASNSSGSVDVPKDDVTPPPVETPPNVGTPPIVETPPVVVSPSSVEPDRARNIPEAAVPITSVVNDAITIASSAFKNLVSKINPPKNEQELGRWVNGHWVPTAEDTIRGINLKKLEDMGFENRDLNATLLARYNDDIRRVVAELVQ